nr:hypothetical protein [uncultured Eisenbergiella sp.]
MDFVTKGEFDVMVGLYDTFTPIGARDKLMLVIMNNSGIRVLKLLHINTKIFTTLINLGIQANILGKRKERTERAIMEDDN